MSYIQKLKRHGLLGSFKKIRTKLVRKFFYANWRYKNIPVYKSPSDDELPIIEKELVDLNIDVKRIQPDKNLFEEFKGKNLFPEHYYGGPKGKVFVEKIFEHWLSYNLLNLKDYKKEDIYIDVAASSSPWARICRETMNINSYAVDLAPVPDEFSMLDYYITANATNLPFEDKSVKGMSLHCAYEMFMRNDDINFINEISRVLATDGKVIILPLYMHTHECAYSTKEFYGKGFVDDGAKEYIRLDAFGVPSSRKYSPSSFVKRVFNTAKDNNLEVKVLVNSNRSYIDESIYCHFILIIERNNFEK